MSTGGFRPETEAGVVLEPSAVGFLPVSPVLAAFPRLPASPLLPGGPSDGAGLEGAAGFGAAEVTAGGAVAEMAEPEGAAIDFCAGLIRHP